MNIEGLDCWDDFPVEHGCICGNDCPPPVRLDPKPWSVEEALTPDNQGSHDAGRYTVADVKDNAAEGEWGGIIYNLDVWSPRPGYSQNQEDYS